MHPYAVSTLNANRAACRLAAAIGAAHVHIVIKRRSAFANWLRSVAGLFDAEGWEV